MKELLGHNKRKKTSRKLFIFNILREIKEDIATTKNQKNRMQVREALQRKKSTSNNQTPLGIKYLMAEIKKKKLSRWAGKIKLRPKCQKDGIWEEENIRKLEDQPGLEVLYPNDRSSRKRQETQRGGNCQRNNSRIISRMELSKWTEVNLYQSTSL